MTKLLNLIAVLALFQAGFSFAQDHWTPIDLAYFQTEGTFFLIESDSGDWETNESAKFRVAYGKPARMMELDSSAKVIRKDGRIDYMFLQLLGPAWAGHTLYLPGSQLRTDRFRTSVPKTPSLGPTQVNAGEPLPRSTMFIQVGDVKLYVQHRLVAVQATHEEFAAAQFHVERLPKPDPLTGRVNLSELLSCLQALSPVAAPKTR